MWRHKMKTTYQYGRIRQVLFSRTGYRNRNVEVEAVLVLLGVRVPHLGTGEAREHAVYDLDAGVWPQLRLLYSGPTEIKIKFYLYFFRERSNAGRLPQQICACIWCLYHFCFAFTSAAWTKAAKSNLIVSHLFWSAFEAIIYTYCFTHVISDAWNIIWEI